MGIPALFRWLSTKYPKVTSQVVETVPQLVGDEEIPVDSSLPNPNGIEFDKLYLDMNGIIHPCCHPEDRPAPATEDEMMIDIFEYIDRIFTMVRPRKLLYMAIDGVAPRAKMNQQRSRRFRAAQEERIKRDDEERLRKEWEKAGETLPQAEEKKERFDSNCITPGTPFMARLADCLKYYVIHRLNNDPGWANVTVLLSDASVPGEGEHKIMDYIRRERNTEGYDPNVQHVLYGLDADLIMLALATHEPHFRVLREDVFFGEGRDRKCFLCGQPGHMADSCTGKKKEKIGDFDEKTVAPTRKPYVFLHIPILREYLAVELSVPSLPFSWSLERSIDDWVFMCFFVGNDFLPHLPSLEIREGAIDTLIGLWKKHLAEWGGYLTDSGDIALERVEKMMEGLGHLEDGVFRKRRDIEDRKRKARMDRKRQAKERQGGVWTERPNPRDAIPAIVAAASTTTLYEKNVVPAVRPSGGSKQANKAAAELLKASLLDVPKMTPKPVAAVEVEDVVKNATIVIDEDVQPHGTKRRIDEVDLETASDDADEAVIEVIDEDATAPVVEIVADDDDDEAPEEVDVPIPDPPKPKKKDDDEESEPDDNVRLWETGWKERYYTNKFDVTLDNAEFRKSIVHSYVEGLCWVLKYYYQGVQSWKWYYPYHYSPFASDFGGTGEFKITFEIGTPFKPIEQLMGVLPADSNKHIPAPFRPLMEQEDSPIYDFYPVQFPIDMNGKKHAWQGVALLPFIDEERLLKHITPIYDQMTPDEVKRNTLGHEVITVSGQAPVFDLVCSAYMKKKGEEPVPLTRTDGAHFIGSILPCDDPCLPGSTLASPLFHLGEENIESNQSISAYFIMPQYAPDFIYKAVLLNGVSMPAPVLDDYDKHNVKINYHGRGHRANQQRNNGANNREVAGRFLKHGIAPTPEAYGYDNRPGTSNEYNRGTGYGDTQKRPRYDHTFPNRRGSYNQSGGNRDYSPQRSNYGGGYRPSDQYGYQDQSRSSQGSYDSRQSYSSNGQYSQQGYYNNQQQSQYQNYGYSGSQNGYAQQQQQPTSYYNQQSTSQNGQYGSQQAYGQQRSGYQSQSRQQYGGYQQSGSYYQSQTQGQSSYYQSQPVHGNAYPAQTQTVQEHVGGLLNSLVQSAAAGTYQSQSQTHAQAQTPSSGEPEFRSQSDWAGGRGQSSRPANIGWNRNVAGSRQSGQQNQRGRGRR